MDDGAPDPVFVNPGSGPDDSPTVEDVAAALGPCGYQVEEVHHPERLPDMVRAALDRSCRTVGVAGGDGTVRCVAEVLAGTGVPMLVVPAGTRNHFSKELGIENLEDAAAAARSGRVRRVSVGSVGGRAFVNNASIGLYPALVRGREQQEARRRRSKTLASLVAAVSIARHAEPMRVALEGREMSAWLVFIGNGRYGEGFGDLVERETLESSVLDVRVLRADRRLARLRVVAAVAAGRMTRSPLVATEQAARFSIGVEGRRIDVALDGEVVSIEAPLQFTIRESALAVLAPAVQETRSD